MIIVNRQFFTLSLVGCTALVTSLGFADPAYAYRFFFGEDLNNDPLVPLGIYPNANSAEINFWGELASYYTQDFEGITTGEIGPIIMDLGIFGTATVSRGTLQTVSPGLTDGAGRYPISGTNYWQGNATGDRLSMSFSNSVAALGFYGVDLGDLGGQLILSLTNGDTRMISVPHTSGTGGSTKGSVLYFGLIAESTDELFTTLSFDINSPAADVFALDNLTVGSPLIAPTPHPTVSQSPPPMPVPEPTSVIGFLGIGLIGARKLKKR